ncbi:uncharacterized protein LOC122524514 [Polistes fuscatus]|uniref:uncharacterized protein LOC122524514 n=1 Tax=Polistes fuscatus TaxID=30207 RepID=UPI001CA7E9A2|nr:uncharacterized protein LOC122524514 [Polistes fuscatus]
MVFLLNDILMTGPNIQNDLRKLLLEFRLHKYVATADIVRMFRQIKINKPYTDYQRFLWREHKDENIRVYRLKTVTDGESCSPFWHLELWINILRSAGMELDKWASNSPEILSKVLEDVKQRDLVF